MSYDRKLLSSVIIEQGGHEQSTTQPASPQIGGFVRHQSLFDDIIDDIEEKDEFKEIAAYAVDSSVEIPLESALFVTPSQSKECVRSDNPSVEATVATASKFRPKDDELMKKGVFDEG